MNLMQKLQREIANARGISIDQPVSSPTHNIERASVESEEKQGERLGDGRSALKVPHGNGKRKYRRHPKVCGLSRQF